jgi:predicted RNase H-like nuclease (RuvC/YqgF family)
MSTLELIDKAIEHCSRFRPSEITFELLNKIKKGIQSKDAEIERLKRELEAAKEETERLRNGNEWVETKIPRHHLPPTE